MKNIIEFKTKESRRELETAEKLVNFSNALDSLMMSFLLNENLEAREIVGILSHRLGSLIALLDEKDELLHICQEILKRQSKID